MWEELKEISNWLDSENHELRYDRKRGKSRNHFPFKCSESSEKYYVNRQWSMKKNYADI